MKLSTTLVTEGVKDTAPIAALAKEIYNGGLGVTSSKLRKFFGAVKKIEVALDMANNRSSEIVLLAPQLAYTVGREKNPSAKGALVKMFEALEPLLKEVGTDRKKFSHFVQVMEVLVAYHRYEEGMGK